MMAAVGDFLQNIIPGIEGVIATIGIIVVAVDRIIHAIRSKVDESLAPIAAMQQDLDFIKEEFLPNGGTSLRDQVVAMKSMVFHITARQWAIVDGLGDPMWESDSDGRCTRANRAMQALTGRGEKELTGNNWENIIHPADQVRVWDEWSKAIQRGRVFESQYRVRGDGKVYTVSAYAAPFIDGEVVSGWLGRFTEVVLE